MWSYEKRLEYPVNIKNPDAKLAMAIISQYGGPDGEMGASMRYLSQRYTMPNRVCMGTLTDIGREAPEMFLSGALAFFRSVCGEASSGCFPVSGLPCGQFTLFATV